MNETPATFASLGNDSLLAHVLSENNFNVFTECVYYSARFNVRTTSEAHSFNIVANDNDRIQIRPPRVSLDS